MSMALQRTDSMDTILDWFANEHPCSCATVGYIARETTLSRETVRRAFKEFIAADAAEQLDSQTGLYRLIEDPRYE